MVKSVKDHESVSLYPNRLFNRSSPTPWAELPALSMQAPGS